MRLAFFAAALILLASPMLAESVFTLKLEIPSSYQKVEQGGEIYYALKAINLGATKRIDVSLKSEVLTVEGIVVAGKTETVAVETQASFVKSIRLPKELPVGKYALRVKLIGPDSEIASEEGFEIVPISAKEDYSIPIAITLILLLGGALYFASPKINIYLERRKLRDRIRGIVKSRLANASGKKAS